MDGGYDGKGKRKKQARKAEQEKRTQERIARLLREELEKETPDDFAGIRRRLGVQKPPARSRRLTRLATAAAACTAALAVAAGGSLVWKGWQLGLFAAASDISRPPDAPFLFTVFSRPSDTGAAGQAAARLGEPLTMLSCAGYNQLGAIGSPWETEEGAEYRLDLELNFSFLGEGLATVTYRRQGSDSLFLRKDGALPQEETTDLFLYEENGQAALLPATQVVGESCTLQAEEQAEARLALRFRVAAEPYSAMDSLQALSGVYDAFREEIQNTRLTALLAFDNGETIAVPLQLGIDDENDHAVTVTLLAPS